MPTRSARPGPLWIAAAAGTLVCLAVMVLGDVRTGGYALGALLLVCGLVRVGLPDDTPLGLAVRSRFVDLAIYLSLAISILVIFRTLKLP